MSEWLSAYAAKPLRRDISPELAMNATRAEADEGARLEIALSVCDGVLRISITVADSES
jgi:hypothetical protein